MPASNMEISDKGVKISYRRYLSDSAPGFIIVLALLICFYLKIPFFGIHVYGLVPEKVPNEILTFSLFILFLLSTPLGLVVNGLSWILLEGLQGFLEWWCVVERKRVFRLYKTMYFFNEFKERYKIDNNNSWRKMIEVSHMKLILKHENLAESIEPVRGLTIFLRSLSFLSLFGIWAFQIPLAVGLIAGTVFLLASASTLFYYQTQIACWNYLIDTGKIIP
jgi:hypothetical protein